MKTGWSARFRAIALVTMALGSACGGDGGSTPPTTVATVVLTLPVGPVAFQTLGRTVPFSAQPRNVQGAVLQDTVTWTSSNPAVASVTAAHGIVVGVTAVGNGTAQITASAGGQTSAPFPVTVGQVAVGITGLPGVVTFGVLGSTWQYSAAVSDSGGSPVPGAAVPVFSRAGAGASATVSATGLVTATGAGIGDTVVVTAGALAARAPIVVSQVADSIAITSTSLTPDTLYTSTRTRQLSLIALDSNKHVMPAPGVLWTSSLASVASVNQSGLVTAGVLDGSTSILAVVGGKGAARTVVVHRYPAIFDISPTGVAISTVGGSQVFTGVAMDSANAGMTVSWFSRRQSFVAVSGGTGGVITATAVRNGPTFLIMSAGTPPQQRRDSALVVVTNQPSPPTTVAISIGDYYFKSDLNGSMPAVDTVALGGTVTWTWTGAANHSVNGSPTMTTGTFTAVANNLTTITYQCLIHGSLMTGTLVVR